MLLTWHADRVAIIERPGHKQLAVEISCATRKEAGKLVRDFGGKFQRISRIALMPPSKPIKIGTRLVVVSRRSGTQLVGRKRLVIPGSGAFGTGEHATTAMCLRLIEKVTRPWPNSWSMLDTGTGSGILALAAQCFGAQRVIAIDNDPHAIAIAKSNARLNRLRGIRFEIADAKKPDTHETFELIAANLFSELLIAAIPKWRTRLKHKGILILSGVLRKQEREVTGALSRSKLEIDEIRRRGKWVAVLARK